VEEMDKYIDERVKLIKKYIKSKDVLDLWVWDISVRFLHKALQKHCKSITWIELDKERSKYLKSMWYNIIQWNAETIDLWKKFDVIVAWDLIEHLENLWIFLENIKKHLKTWWYFLFNTPNAYSINFLIRGILLWWNVKQFEEHTLLFTEQLIRNLLERYNMKIEKTIYFTHKQNTLSKIIKLFWLISKKRHEHMFFVIKN